MKEKKYQEDIFLFGEGDKYFERNRSALNVNNVGRGYKFYEKYIKVGGRILEIGCSQGHNLQYFHQMKHCECYGIDPSREAIERGRKDFPALNLFVGVSNQLDFESKYFDFVLFGFCLYLVDRAYLFKSIAEADRVLKPGGVMGITDFDVKIPTKRVYKHCEGVFSYKMDYSQILLASPHYSLIDKYSFSHSSDSFTEDSADRLSSVILFKEYVNGYKND